VELSSSSLSGESDFEDDVDYSDEPAPPDQSKFLHVSEEEIYEGEPSTVSPLAIILAEGTLFIFRPNFSLHIEEDVLTFFFYVAGLAGDAEATTSSHIEEMVKELTQPEGIEASVAEITSEGATVEIGEPSTLPEEEATTEAEEVLTLQGEEATAEAGETSTPRDSPSLDLQPSKAALMF